MRRRSAIPALLAALALLQGCAAVLHGAGSRWVSPIGREHPLAGRVWQVRASRFVGFAELEEDAARADVVLLGERHDNVDHHRLQASLLSSLLAAGRRPAVAFEQLDLGKQVAVDLALDREGSVSDVASSVAEAVEWERSGWPPFDDYRPVFEIAIRASLPIRAANLSRSALTERFAAAHGSTGGSAAVAPRRDAGSVAGGCSSGEVPMPRALREAMAKDVRESHCGHASEGMVAWMIEAQRSRDAAMADAVLGAFEASSRAAGTADSPMHGGASRRVRGGFARPGAVLVCGFGHARRDLGVPLYLRQLAPSRRTLSIAFLEVAPGADLPSDYAEGFHVDGLPFDYVVFTPRVDAEDPCEKFRAQLEKMKQAPVGPPKQATPVGPARPPSPAAGSAN